MSGVLIHDGRRPGHRKWLVEAISSGHASGGFLTPFSSPRVTQPRHPSAHEVAQSIEKAGGEVIFDPMTHARLLSGTNRLDFYDNWDLWGSTGPDLSTPAAQLDHIERVFARQDTLQSVRLGPTINLKSPSGLDAARALSLAERTARLDTQAWQAVAGTRDFWASGAALDAHVGALAALRSPAWVLTITNDLVVDNTPDFSRTDSFVGLYRTVVSLSLRSRVILAYSDYSGLPAIAAGADSVGSGWDRGQRTFDPLSFHEDSDPGIRIPASYVTQGDLNAVLRRDAADAIARWNSRRARAIRGGAMPASDNEERMHHLARLTEAVDDVHSAGAGLRPRVGALRGRYDTARATFDELLSAIPGTFRPAIRSTWCDAPRTALDSFAATEGV